MKQKISEINESERAWIKAQLDAAASFVATFAPADKDDPLSLTSLDRAFAAWIGSKPGDGNFINEVINGVGIAFGNHLVEGLGFEWVIATDDQATELAVYALPGKGDALVYPANFVAKRWERREVNFLEASYQSIEKDVQRLKQSYAQKPWWRIW